MCAQGCASCNVVAQRQACTPRDAADLTFAACESWCGTGSYNCAFCKCKSCGTCPRCLPWCSTPADCASKACQTCGMCGGGTELIRCADWCRSKHCDANQPNHDMCADCTICGAPQRPPPKPSPPEPPPPPPPPPAPRSARPRHPRPPPQPKPPRPPSQHAHADQGAPPTPPLPLADAWSEAEGAEKIDSAGRASDGGMGGGEDSLVGGGSSAGGDLASPQHPLDDVSSHQQVPALVLRQQQAPLIGTPTGGAPAAVARSPITPHFVDSVVQHVGALPGGPLFLLGIAVILCIGALAVMHVCVSHTPRDARGSLSRIPLDEFDEDDDDDDDEGGGGHHRVDTRKQGLYEQPAAVRRFARAPHINGRAVMVPARQGGTRALCAEERAMLSQS